MNKLTNKAWKFIFLCLVLSLSSCSYITYEDFYVKYSMLYLGTDKKIGPIEITSLPDGRKTVIVEKISTKQSKGLEAISKGITSGAIKGLKPL